MSRVSAHPAARRAFHVIIVTIVALSAIAFRTVRPVEAQATAATHEVRFADQIAAFLDADKKAPPPQQAILFIGSSIFRQWTNVEEQMAPLPVFNRAFGGSRTWEVLHYMDQIVLPYHPRIIVYYTGSNDVNAGEPAAAITGRIKEFIARVHTALPGTRVYFVAINKSPDKRARWDVVEAANAEMKAMAATTPYVKFIDMNPAIFDSKGEPRMDLYREDGLHFYPPAYVEFTKIVKPVLTAAWREMSH